MDKLCENKLKNGYNGKMLSHVLEKKESCLSMISPLDVQIDCDDKTMVQPDVIIVCDRDKVINRCVYGAPDFVAEILSKTSRRRIILLSMDLMQCCRSGYWTENAGLILRKCMSISVFSMREKSDKGIKKV